jgi:hypothetical protein
VTVTYVENPTISHHSQISSIEDYVSGQISDGWGENGCTYGDYLYSFNWEQPRMYDREMTDEETEEGLRIVDEKIVYGCVSMPSNVFATTGTNVSVLFFDKSKSHDKVVLVDASKMGEEYKDGNKQRTRLLDNEIEVIVDTFINEKVVEDFSVIVSYDEIKEKGYSLSAGQYFDIKIQYEDITEGEFQERMSNYRNELVEQFAKSRKLEEEIIHQFNLLKFSERNADV